MKIGEALIEQGLVTEEQLELALGEHQKGGLRLGETLVSLGYLEQDVLYGALSRHLNVPFVRISEKEVEPDAISSVPAKVVCHYGIFPLKQDDGALVFATPDPTDIDLQDDLHLVLGCSVRPVLASNKDIWDAIKKYYGVGADTIEKMMAENGTEADLDTVESMEQIDLEKMDSEATIIKFVNQIIVEAFRDRATDIHIEPFDEKLRIRYRIDGVLYEISVPSAIKNFEAAIVSRIKVMAGLNIAEKRLPQDGRIKIRMANQDLDLRVSVLPTPLGETINIRILQRSTVFYGLEELGLVRENLSDIERVIQRPHGIVLVSGPTGSGKTTTLYASLAKINSIDRKILTIEDPIEYQLEGITQMQVQPKIGFSFAQALRSMLRHDPDIMMVGEIRDFETAEIAIRSALTGHLVFSTVHTNDAASAITRLIDIGVEPYLLSSSIECIVAQRLVRLICPDCRIKYEPEPGAIKQMGLGIDKLKRGKLMRGAGCDKCRNSGYRGRTGIFEIIVFNDELKKLALERVPASVYRQCARKYGMRTLREDGLHKVIEGQTTVEEVLRVTQETEEAEAVAEINHNQ